jgi:hypothetical protein
MEHRTMSAFGRLKVKLAKGHWHLAREQLAGMFSQRSCQSLDQRSIQAKLFWWL